MTKALKRYSTIGCCGIDCGLCPRFHTRGDSVCPGCGGLNFREKHPSCGFLTCCVIKKGWEVCADCRDYPCSRFDPERKGADSFVTHKKVFPNLDFIKNSGMDRFIGQQKSRMTILNDFLANFDDGRSKSFYCLGCALLPLAELQEARGSMDRLGDVRDSKEKSKILKEKLLRIADQLKIDLKLNKK